MANQYLKRTTIRVEGIDDLNAVAHLLKLHAFDMDAKPRRDVELFDAKGRARLLDSVGPAVRAATGQAVGFVVDADASAARTWDAVRHHLDAVAGLGGGRPEAVPGERRRPRHRGAQGPGGRLDHARQR